MFPPRGTNSTEIGTKWNDLSETEEMALKRIITNVFKGFKENISKNLNELREESNELIETPEDTYIWVEKERQLAV